MTPSAGYSGKPLVAKLGIKPGHRLAVRNPPHGFALGDLPEGVVTPGPSARSLDVILCFVPDRATLERRLGAELGRLVPGGMLWVSWPKKSSGVPTDLTEDRVREVGLAAGWVDVKVCAVDEVWSGLKFLKRRTAGVAGRRR